MIVAIVILLIIVFVTIIVAVIGITIVWRERKSKLPTKEEHVYSTIDEPKLQGTPQSKPEKVYSELIDVQVSKEEPCHMKTSKCAQSTIAENVTIQDNPSYSIISDHHVKIQDNPAYSTWLYHEDEIKDDPSHSEQQRKTKVYNIPSEHQGETQAYTISSEHQDEST